jgi:predicted aminopeptidase
LPDNSSYTRYADLKRPFVVWNVYATPELSLRLKQSCFPVVGCLDYRGYYSEADARGLAKELKQQGWEVTVGGVPAYSTLGWYADPLVNTLIRYPAGEVARLIFHELAHQAVYAKNDTMFNESFATTVEEVGMEHWLAEPENQHLKAQYMAFADRKRDFVALLLDTRKRLEAVYHEDTPDAKKAKPPTHPTSQGLTEQEIATRRQGKAQVLADLRVRYEALKRDKWGGYAGYDAWFNGDIDNARFASVGTYHQWGPALRAMVDQCESCKTGNLRDFLEQARILADEPAAERRRRLVAAMPGSTQLTSTGVTH